MDGTVVWLPDAETELAAIWLSSSERNLVTVAADQIDARLRHDPENVGESRSEGRRVLIVPPLVAFYRVNPDDRIVRVVHVREATTKS
jgi:plasmid stabilization system protein ParE